MFLVNQAATGLDLNAHHQSLTETQVTAIARALPGGWSIDRHFTAEEGLSLMVSIGGSSDLEMVFYIDSEPAGLSLSVMRNDTLEHMGCYGNVDGMVAAMLAAA